MYHNPPQTRPNPAIGCVRALIMADVSKPVEDIISPLNQSENRPSDDLNTEPVQKFEEQTIEHERAILTLKRTRNSLLNVFKLPPEVLGNIFCWNAAPTDDFLGWEDESHSFLLVCHHWFEVASRTPELWSFWGTTPMEWKRCYRHSMSAPLDLALEAYTHTHCGSFDTTLRNVLRDRATRDTIRRIHLESDNPELLSSIVSSLTTNCEGLQSNSVESFIFLNSSTTPVDLSGFLAHYRFPKLQHFDITGHATAQWDFLWSRTGALTTLILGSESRSRITTTSQLLSILAFNPTLREVSLSVLPSRNAITSSFRVPLHQLKQLKLSGGVRDVVVVLHRLDHPGKVDLRLELYKCKVGDITQVIIPYLRDFFGRHDGPQTELGLFVSQSMHSIGYSAGDVGKLDPSAPEWNLVAWLVNLDIYLDAKPPEDVLGQSILDLLAYIPQEEVLYPRACGGPTAAQATATQFPKITLLYFDETRLSALPNPERDREIFPSLRCVVLDRVVVDDYDWSPLTTFLARRASSGNRLEALEIFTRFHMCKDVADGIKGMVRHFQTRDQELLEPCPFITCPKP